MTHQYDVAVGDSKNEFTFHTELIKVRHIQRVAPLDGCGDTQDLPTKAPRLLTYLYTVA